MAGLFLAFVLVVAVSNMAGAYVKNMYNNPKS